MTAVPSAPDLSPAPSASTNPMLAAPVLPTLLRLTLPNLAAMLTAALVAIAETIYVGRLGAVPLAAIALVFPLTMLMQMLSAGALGGGVSSAISRALGAGDQARAGRLATHAAFIGLAAGLGFSMLFLLSARPLLYSLGGRGLVLDEAVAYANIALAAAVLTWLANTLASILRGTGNMRVPSLTLLVASLLQIAIGGVLGLGLGPIPSFGLAGVGAGLAIAMAMAAAVLLWFLRRPPARVRLRVGALDGAMFRDILKVGLVSAFGPLQVVITVLVLTRIVSAYGTETLAGYGIGARLEFLLVPIVFAIGVACVPMVGMAIGARQIERARRVAWSAAALAAGVLGVIGLAVTVAPDLWSGLFTGEGQVRAAANLYLRTTGPGYAFVGIGLALYFASQGSGRVMAVVLAGWTRPVTVIIGGIVLVQAGASGVAIYTLVAVSMVAFGLSVAAAVYFTNWGPRPRSP